MLTDSATQIFINNILRCDKIILDQTEDKKLTCRDLPTISQLRTGNPALEGRDSGSDFSCFSGSLKQQ